jgi:hypothetical protein
MIKVLLGDSTLSVLNLSTRSLSSSTVAWMVALCSPRPEGGVWFV